MFKKIVFALLVAVGCGDGPSYDSPVDGVCPAGSTHPDCEQPADAGQVVTLEQSIILNNNHGMTLSHNECTLPFPGGWCYGPNNRTFWINFHAYSCLTDVAPHNGAWWYQAIWAGLVRSRDYLNVRGWNVTLTKQDTGGRTNFGHVQVYCFNDSGAIGQTSINESFPDHIFDCHDTVNGEYCQYSRANIFIRPLRAQSNPIWSTTTSTNRGNMINNVTFHEMMHFAGLGHRPHDSNNMNIMMPAIQAWLSPQWTTKMVPDVYQSLAIYCYVPTSSTTPIVGCPG